MQLWNLLPVFMLSEISGGGGGEEERERVGAFAPYVPPPHSKDLVYIYRAFP